MNNVGKPRKYTFDEVNDLINEYFNNTPQDELTITGLSLLFGSKQLLNDYQKRQEFKDIITTAKLRIENKYEMALSKKSPTGAIFALKNMGWKDTQAIDHTSTGKHISNKMQIEFVDFTDNED